MDRFLNMEEDGETQGSCFFIMTTYIFKFSLLIASFSELKFSCLLHARHGNVIHIVNFGLVMQRRRPATNYAHGDALSDLRLRKSAEFLHLPDCQAAYRGITLRRRGLDLIHRSSSARCQKGCQK